MGARYEFLEPGATLVTDPVDMDMITEEGSVDAENDKSYLVLGGNENATAAVLVGTKAEIISQLQGYITVVRTSPGNEEDDHRFQAIDPESDDAEKFAICKRCGDAQDSQNHALDADSITTPLEEILGYDPDESVVRMNWTMNDVASIAEQHSIDIEVAVDRAREWGRHIEDSLSGNAGEQLVSVVTVGQP